MSVALPIDEPTLGVLEELARAERRPIPEVLRDAVEEYRRRSFLESLAADFAALRTDSDAWRGELAERAAWDRTLSDGLDPE